MENSPPGIQTIPSGTVDGAGIGFVSVGPKFGFAEIPAFSGAKAPAKFASSFLEQAPKATASSPDNSPQLCLSNGNGAVEFALGVIWV